MNQPAIVRRDPHFLRFVENLGVDRKDVRIVPAGSDVGAFEQRDVTRRLGGLATSAGVDVRNRMRFEWSDARSAGFSVACDEGCRVGRIQ